MRHQQHTTGAPEIKRQSWVLALEEAGDGSKQRGVGSATMLQAVSSVS